MAAPTPMDISDAGGERGRSGSLAVNKSSNKISKNGRSRALPPPRPEPKIFQIEPSDFRTTVQKLTAQEPAAAPSRSSFNSRLSKMAPPPLPLRPSVSYSKMPQPPHLPALMSPTQNGERVVNVNPLLSSWQQRLSPKPVSPFPLLTPSAFGPLPALSPNDRWADLESPGTALMMQQMSQAMASNAAAAQQRIDVAVQQRLDNAAFQPRLESSVLPQFPMRLDAGHGGMTQELAGLYPQFVSRMDLGNGMLPQFASRAESAFAGQTQFPAKMESGFGSVQQQFAPRMESSYGGGFPQFQQPRVESGGAGFPQFPSRMEAGGAAFPSYQQRIEPGLGSIPTLSPRMDAHGLAPSYSPLSPSFLPPLSPTLSLPPLSPTFPFSPLAFGNQDPGLASGFGLNNVYGGFGNSLSPTAGLTNDSFCFPDRMLS